MELNMDENYVDHVVPVVSRQIFPFEDNDALDNEDDDDGSSMAVFVESHAPSPWTPASFDLSSTTTTAAERRRGEESGGGGICRICHQFEDEEGEALLSPCKCTAHVHRSCLENWLTISNRDHCEVCLHPFKIVRVYGSIFKYLRLGLSQKKRRFLFVDLTWLIFSSYMVVNLILNSMDASVSDWYKSGYVLPVGTLLMNGLAVASYTSWLFCGVSYYRTHWKVWRRKNSRVRLLTDQPSTIVAAVSSHHSRQEDQLSTHGHDEEVTSDTRPFFRPEIDQ